MLFKNRNLTHKNKIFLIPFFSGGRVPWEVVEVVGLPRASCSFLPTLGCLPPSPPRHMHAGIWQWSCVLRKLRKYRLELLKVSLGKGNLYMSAEGVMGKAPHPVLDSARCSECLSRFNSGFLLWMHYCYTSSSVDITHQWLENDKWQTMSDPDSLQLFLSVISLWNKMPTPCWVFLKMPVVSSHKGQDGGGKEKNRRKRRGGGEEKRRKGIHSDFSGLKCKSKNLLG